MSRSEALKSGGERHQPAPVSISWAETGVGSQRLDGRYALGKRLDRKRPSSRFGERPGKRISAPGHNLGPSDRDRPAGDQSPGGEPDPPRGLDPVPGVECDDQRHRHRGRPVLEPSVEEDGAPCELRFTSWGRRAVQVLARLVAVRSVGRPERWPARLLRLGDGPSATPELERELLGRQVAHQLLLSGEPRRRRSGERAPIELAAL